MERIKFNDSKHHFYWQCIFPITLFFTFLLIPPFLSAQTIQENNMNSYVGHRHLTIVDDEKNISFPVLIMYPTHIPSKQISLGPFVIHSTQGAPVGDGKYPIIIISHGTGGTHLGYLTIAQYLTEHGYIVAMPEHYGNNHNNNDLEGTMSNLENRPRHISLVIDALSGDPQLKDHGQHNNVAIIGHSMGGYTALAVAGGEPWSESKEKVKVRADNRIKALVLLAPATYWYIPESSLDNINIPIFMLTAEHDKPLPSGWHKETSEIVLSHLPSTTPIIFRVVENAGHFSFLSPFPDSMQSPNFPPSTDPDGFDRDKFHNALNVEIRTFLDPILSKQR